MTLHAANSQGWPGRFPPRFKPLPAIPSKNLRLFPCRADKEESFPAALPLRRTGRDGAPSAFPAPTPEFDPGRSLPCRKPGPLSRPEHAISLVVYYLRRNESAARSHRKRTCAILEAQGFLLNTG
ncbi:MAG: hypothetical protein M0T83_01260 [Nitrospiraceae bacterium]|nr:hypothetical protein [Nitrospiraceae bacterium]